MPIYSKESLEALRRSIDLVEVISSNVDLKRTGSSYKGLCPFHDEKTPSFMIQKGDDHYHCFGCGAHGDAIHFLMTLQRLSFSDAVESLAEKFQVHLDVIEGKTENKGPSKKILKEALEKASRFFQFYLLHTPEGYEAIKYLSKRSIYTDFIRQFKIGLAPKQIGMLKKILNEQGVTDDVMLASGLLRSSGGYRDFFLDRITFPIHDPSGMVIGFSARKYKEETFGGKYVNTSETSLFKKSRVLFGLNYCRRRIAKERQVIIVEGQIDALRLIHEGFNFVVAGQGTAFGEEHIHELMNLGISQVYLGLDSDEAGVEAAAKIGNLFQNEGVEVDVITFPPGRDPDSFLREEGPDKLAHLLENSTPYLDFLVEFHSRAINVSTPAGKNEIVKILTHQIRGWKHSLMIHESLKRIANLLQVPEHMIGVGQEYSPNIHIRKSASIGLQKVDPTRILESDFLRWLLLMGGQLPRLIKIADLNIQPHHLINSSCQRIYQTYLRRAHNNLHCDILSLIEQEEDQELLSNIMEKKVNLDKAEEHFIETVQKILDRDWMEKREEIKRKIQSGQCSDEDALLLLKQFDELKKAHPKVLLPDLDTRELRKTAKELHNYE
jgi:DNA primase